MTKFARPSLFILVASAALAMTSAAAQASEVTASTDRAAQDGIVVKPQNPFYAQDPDVARTVSLGGSCVRCELSGRDLSGATFISATFTGSTLVGANLRGAELVGSNFSGADFSRADLRGATLVGANAPTHTGA